MAKPARSCWGFVYTRNVRQDYAFLVFPEPLMETPGARSDLEAVLDGRAEGITGKTVLLDRGKWHLYYRVTDAEADKSPVFDHVGRQITLIRGLISRAPLPPADAAAELRRFEDLTDGITRLFWGLPRVGPIPSVAGASLSPAPRWGARFWFGMTLLLAATLAVSVLGTQQSGPAAKKIVHNHRQSDDAKRR